MEMAEIRCGQCSSLMAVPQQLLGQQVRCPHCQQVVLTPAATSPASPEEDVEATISLPVRELPSHQAVPDCEDATIRLEIATDAESNLTQQAAACEETMRVPPTAHDSAAEPDFLANDPTILEPLPSRGSDRPSSPRAASGQPSWLLLGVTLPLFLYAVLATVAIVLLWNRLQQQPPHPLEMFPDVEGDTPGVQKNGKKTSPVRGQIAPEHLRKLAEIPLPRQLCVSLGNTLRVGDLEVTPRRVERKVVRVFVTGFPRPEPCLHESLVLHLHLHNVSEDVTFTPLDNYFDRRWRKGKRTGPPPLTVLEMGSQRFYGGPAEWSPVGGVAAERRQWVEGRKNLDSLGLGPGEALDTFVCTDGDDATVLPELERFHGTLLWRVQLRRGLVRVGQREIPATAVVGVEFTARDVFAAGEG